MEARLNKRRGVARVVPLDRDTRPGTAFAISPDLALTAFHCAGRREGAAVELEVEGGARVVASALVGDNDSDLAVLKLGGSLPRDVGPIPWVEFTPAMEGQRFVAEGYGVERPPGTAPHAVDGHIVRATTLFDRAPALQLNSNQLIAGENAHAFSGGPVLVQVPGDRYLPLLAAVGVVRWQGERPDVPGKAIGGDFYATPVSHAIELWSALLTVAAGRAPGDAVPFGLRSPAPSWADSLPARRPCYGREAIIRDIVNSVLRVPPVPTPVLGAPGIGKSALCRAVAYEASVVERFGERRYWVRCDGAPTAGALVTKIAAVLGVRPVGGIERYVFAALSDKPALLTLDNAETPWLADMSATEELLTRLTQLPGLALLASFRGTRRPLGPMWRSSIEVPPLDLRDAQKLFFDAAGHRLAGDPELDPLLTDLDGMPIAVELLGFQAQDEESLVELRTRWRQQRTELLKRGAGLDPALSAAASFELSINSPHVSVDARRLLSLLGWLPDGIAVDDLEEVLPEHSLDSAAALRHAGLAFVEHGRLRTLKPIRDHVAAEYRPRPDDHFRASRHYMRLAVKLGGMALRDGGGAANARLAAETANLRRVLSEALKGHGGAEALRATDALTSFVVATGASIEGVFDQAVTRAAQLGDTALEAKALFSRGRIALARSDYVDANKWFEKALALNIAAGNVQGEAICLRGLGEVALARWDHKAVVDRLGRARDLFHSIGDAAGEATCIRGIAHSSQDRGDLPAADKGLTEALRLFREAQDVLGTATCLMRLGEIAIEREEDIVAEQNFDSALPLYREAGSVLGEANCVVGFGNAAVLRGDYDIARERFSEALALYERVRERYSIGQTHRRLAGVASHAEARQAHRDAAIKAWTSIDRQDLIERHFPSDT